MIWGLNFSLLISLVNSWSKNTWSLSHIRFWEEADGWWVSPDLSFQKHAGFIRQERTRGKIVSNSFSSPSTRTTGDDSRVLDSRWKLTSLGRCSMDMSWSRHPNRQFTTWWWRINTTAKLSHAKWFQKVGHPSNDCRTKDAEQFPLPSQVVRSY